MKAHEHIAEAHGTRHGPGQIVIEQAGPAEQTEGVRVRCRNAKTLVGDDMVGRIKAGLDGPSGRCT